ncbi:hypothetical protein [Sphingomonas sp. Leaf22]|uniref:hypothetical protein n=1 Tax=Sphingomonas sp. Leaf22 TaxID=1735687 RepID=UPI0012E16556|nr:hypothetical protein [Sphingomonas sp. Leaf22]
MMRAVVALAVADMAMLAAAPVWPGPLLLIGHIGCSIAAIMLRLRDGRALRFSAIVFGMIAPAALLAGEWASRTLPDDDRPPAPLPEPVVRSGKAQRGASLTIARMLDGRVLHAEADALHSLVTIMRHGQVAERRRALETVVRSFQPSLSPLIALALTDGDQTIRALAAAASARIVQNLATGRAALEAASGPERDAALAAMLADHARGNVLLSDTQRAHLRTDALALIGDHPLDPTRIEALWAAGDYAAIDAIVEQAPVDASPYDRVARATGWWRGQTIRHRP